VGSARLKVIHREPVGFSKLDARLGPVPYALRSVMPRRRSHPLTVAEVAEYIAASAGLRLTPNTDSALGAGCAVCRSARSTFASTDQVT